MYWFSLTLIWLGTAANCDGDKKGKSLYMGYHRTIGIPTAAKMKDIEAKIMENDGIDSRIVGGTPTVHQKYPWLAGLLIYDHNERVLTHSMCGGSLLDKTRVITAAHCIMEKDFELEYIEVVLGSDYLFSGGLRTKTYEMVTYPGWTGEHKREQVDAGIIFIRDITSYEWSIQPVSLPSSILLNESFAGYTANAAGYGDILSTPDPVASEVNNEVELEIRPPDHCSSKSVPSWWLCTSGILENSVVGTCQGDSGGPLTVTMCDKNILVGIITRSFRNCEFGVSSYYTRVTSIMDFITNNEKPS